MRFPAYVLLPILGAVLLTAAVLGSWLWPAPTVPAPSREPSVVAVPVASESPAPTPAPLPPPSRPVSRPVVAKAAPVAQPPSEPVAVAPAPPMAPPGSQITDLSPQAREGIQKKWSSLRNRAADMALRGVESLERQRDDARARGDQAEYERLEALIRQHRERVELMRGARPEAPGAGPGVPPPAQSGPPLQ
jgi:hypothetical protein